MQSHPTSLHVHLVATACVFNLTTQDLAEAMPVSLLSSTVTQLLHSMKTFPNHQQVRGDMFSVSGYTSIMISCTYTTAKCGTEADFARSWLVIHQILTSYLAHAVAAPILPPSDSICSYFIILDPHIFFCPYGSSIYELFSISPGAEELPAGALQ